MDLSESEEEPWNFAALYLSEGAPIGFLWFAGVSVGSITALTSLLVLPWTLKFLWAPLVDVLRPRRGGRRTWVLGAQLVMGLALLPLAVLDPVSAFGWFGWLVPLLLVHGMLQ